MFPETLCRQTLGELTFVVAARKMSGRFGLSLAGRYLLVVTCETLSLWVALVRRAACLQRGG
ncbi:MAG TPA: hypothetical protein DCY79_02955 [Planctomycetaceae bacterium]|nr:hypothetical protein [Blastopirellula sp.]HAY78750.1 hypothetical protein [Planctomycetaceae bacterium]